MSGALNSFDLEILNLAYDMEIRTGGFCLNSVDETFIKAFSLKPSENGTRALLAHNVSVADYVIILASETSMDKNVKDIKKFCDKDYKKPYQQIAPNLTQSNGIDKLALHPITQNNLTDIFIYTDVVTYISKVDVKDCLDILQTIFSCLTSMSIKYGLFSFSHYQPKGGWGDFVGAFSTVKEAKKYATKLKKQKLDQWQIVNMSTGKIVKEREWHL